MCNCVHFKCLVLCRQPQLLGNAAFGNGSPVDAIDADVVDNYNN